MVIQKIKMLFLRLLAIIRMAFCCFGRRQHGNFQNEDDDESMEALQCISIVKDNDTPRSERKQQREHDWNSWDDSPRTVEEHIEHYRQRMAKTTTPQTEEPEPDFFSELTPVIRPQLKYYLGDDNVVQTDFSRLQAKTDVPIAMNPDLEDWSEDGHGGWDELDSEKTKEMIREKRREIRSQRQKNPSKPYGLEIQNNIGIGGKGTRSHGMNPHHYT